VARGLAHVPLVISGAYTAATFDATGTEFQLNLDHRVGLAVLPVNLAVVEAYDSISFPAAEG
jgi:hypothetical protein